MKHDPIYLDVFEHVDCCGRSHVVNFPDRNSLYYSHGIPREGRLDAYAPGLLKEGLRLGLEEAYDQNVQSGAKKPGHVVEVTLTDSQAKTWDDTLEWFGFEKVTRFRNHKSGNYVNVYLNNIGRYVVRRKIGRAKG